MITTLGLSGCHSSTAPIPMATVLLSGTTTAPAALSNIVDDAPAPGMTRDVVAASTSPITAVLVKVIGPGIPDTLLFDLGAPQTGGATLPKAVSLPVGPGRVFIAEAYIGSIKAYAGTQVADVPEEGLSLSLYLARLTGATGIGTIFEGFTVGVDNAATYRGSISTLSVARGSTTSFTTKVTRTSTGGGYAAGDPVAGKTVQWAISVPGAAVLNAGTCVTGATGTCTVTVTVPNSVKSGVTTNLQATVDGDTHIVAITVL